MLCYSTYSIKYDTDKKGNEKYNTYKLNLTSLGKKGPKSDMQQKAEMFPISKTERHRTRLALLVPVSVCADSSILSLFSAGEHLWQLKALNGGTHFNRGSIISVYLLFQSMITGMYFATE